MINGALLSLSLHTLDSELVVHQATDTLPAARRSDRLVATIDALLPLHLLASIE